MTEIGDRRRRGDAEGPWRNPVTSGSAVGRRVANGEFIEKVRGTLQYADDWQVPGTLCGKVVRSPRSAARIASMDTTAASAVPGVFAVITASGVPVNRVHEEVSGFDLPVPSAPVLASELVRYEGEPVALVAATDSETADLAAELIAIEFEEQLGVYDPADALVPDAPRVHPTGNVVVDYRIARGNVEDAFAAADVVVEGLYRTQRVDHAYLEPEAGVGWISGDGVLTLQVSTQVVEHAATIAEIVGLPQSRVRVIGTYVGGGFGGKEDMTIEPYLAVLAWKTRRPVKMVWSRQESLLARPKRHPFTMRYRTAATQSGDIVAQDIDLLGDAGAYAMLSPRVMFAAAVTAVGPYRCPNVRIRSRAAYTNNVPTSAFRGFGAMQVTLAYESQMDRVADEIGMDRIAVRLRNYLRKGDVLPTGEEIETNVALPETTRAAVELLGQPRTPSSAWCRVGRGIASNIQPYGRATFFGDQASAWISVEADGSVVVRCGVLDLGGGQGASLAEIAAEVFGVTLDRVSVHLGDSQLTPPAGGTFATRQLYMSGNAVLKSAVELRHRLALVAAEQLDVAPDDLEFVGDRVRAKNGSAIELAALVRACRGRGLSTSHLGQFAPRKSTFDMVRGHGRTFADFTFGTHACEVEIDCRTGRLTILAYAASHDVGRALNPLRVEGQIEGGVVQGIGQALSEEVTVEHGATASTLFADYLIPNAVDAPRVQVRIIESGDGKGPFNSRGIGEPPVGPAAPAIASAISAAIGARLVELPFTPERILAALNRDAANRQQTTPWGTGS
jgi:CO/xanthine dehydrogenase Mo-binding subunit